MRGGTSPLTPMAPTTSGWPAATILTGLHRWRRWRSSTVRRRRRLQRLRRPRRLQRQLHLQVRRRGRLRHRAHARHRIRAPRPSAKVEFVNEGNSRGNSRVPFFYGWRAAPIENGGVNSASAGIVGDWSFAASKALRRLGLRCRGAPPSIVSAKILKKC